MRNLKKFLSLLLAVMMIATAGIIVSAEDEADYTEAVEVLKGIGVLKGYGDGNFGEKDSVSRIQMALLVARMMESKYSDEDQNYFEEYYGDYEGSFTDMVTEDYDYSNYEGAANYCDIKGIIKGVSKEEKIFNPTGLITLDEAITMVCRALGYDSDVWPVSFRIFANEHGILTNLETVDWKDSLTREETAQLLYNMINVLSGNDLGAEAWPYAGEHFADFVNLEKRTTIKDCVLYTVISNNKVDVYTVPCTKLTTDKYDVLYDSKLNEVEEKNAEYAYIVCYELYDGTVAGVYVTGKFNGKFTDEAAIEYEDGNSVALTVSALRYNGTDKDGKIILADSEGNETAYVLDAETVKTLTKNSVYYWALNEKEIVAFKATNPTKDLGILTGIEIEEDENGEYTGNFVATVLRESTGFKTEEKISVRSIYSEAVKYKNEWADNLDKDLTIKDIITRDNAVYEAYLKLFGILEDASWLVEIELDELGAYDLSVWETYRGNLITVNEYAKDNVLADVDGITWPEDSNKNGVADENEVKRDEKELGYDSDLAFVEKWVDKDAEGKYFTLSEDVTYVVVNNYTGKVEIFQNEPMQGQWLCGDFAYSTVVNEAGYCVVVVDEFTGPFDLEPRAQYVQVEDLAGWSKMNKSTFELGGYKIPLYTFDYTVSGMTTPNGEDVDDIVFEGLTEAQHSALKTEMSIWNDYVVENEFIYRLHTNEGKWTEEIVPFMYFEVSTWAEYWEEYDVYEATLSWVTGRELLNHQDKFFAMFDQWYAAQKDVELDDYKVKYNELDKVAYLDYTNSEAISKYYTYDVGLTLDEETETLYVHYEKVGVLVEAGKYEYDANNNGKIDDDEKDFTYELYINMPGYASPAHVEKTYPEYNNNDEGFYAPFGTNLYVEASQANIRKGDSAKGYMYVAGEKVEIVLKDGVTKVDELKWNARDGVDNYAQIDLGNDVFKLDNQTTTEWNALFSNVTNIKKYSKDNEYTTQYIGWDENSVDDMTVKYQKFTVSTGKEIYKTEDTSYGSHWAYKANISTSVEELENGDKFNIYDWAVSGIVYYDSVAAFEADKAEYGTRIEFWDNETVGAAWFTYVELKQYAPGNNVYGTIGCPDTKELHDELADYVDGEILEGYYLVESNKDAYEAQFKDGGSYKKDGVQTIFPVCINLHTDFLTLNVMDTAKKYEYVRDDHGYGKENPYNYNSEDDVVDIFFVDVYEDERDAKGNLVAYEYEDWSDVIKEDCLTGWADDVTLVGGHHAIEAKDVKAVTEETAHNWYKVVVTDKRVGTIVESGRRYFSTLSAQDTMDKAEAEFMVGATLAYSTLVKVLIALRKAIIGA